MSGREIRIRRLIVRVDDTTVPARDAEALVRRALETAAVPLARSGGGHVTRSPAAAVVRRAPGRDDSQLADRIAQAIATAVRGGTSTTGDGR